MSIPEPYYQDELCIIYHADCRDIVPHLGMFDLLLADPPYGLSESSRNHSSRGKLAVAKSYGTLSWDTNPIDSLVIENLVSLSKHAIIFGGNYYPMPPSQCWLVWDKKNHGNDFADCELAWTNLPGSVRKIDYTWNGMLKQIPEKRFHPTQKPLTVMRWCIETAMKKTKKDIKTILDPFMGSGTTLRAAKDLGIKCVGIDSHKDYCDTAIERLRQEVYYNVQKTQQER